MYLSTTFCNAWSIPLACRLQKGGLEVHPFLSFLLSPFSLGSRKPYGDEDDDTPAATPLSAIRVPLFALSESSEDAIGDPRESWVEKVDFLLSPRFWAKPRIFWNGVVPSAQSTGCKKGTSAQRYCARRCLNIKEQLIGFRCRLTRGFLVCFSGKSARVLASSRFSSPAQHDTPSELIGTRISC